MENSSNINSDPKSTDGVLYRMRDFVYLDESPSQPFKLGQILNFKTGPNSTVFARIRFYERRRDLDSVTLKRLCSIEEKYLYNSDYSLCNFSRDCSSETIAKMNHQFQLRQLICNRHNVNDSEEGYINASLIRGKCVIQKFIDVECIKDYINSEDIFFYVAAFDDHPRHLVPEGEQSVPHHDRHSRSAPVDNHPLLNHEQLKQYKNKKHNLDVIVWDGPKCSLSDKEMESFLSLVRSVGLFGRALDQTRRVSDSSIQANLAYTFRDSSKYLAYNILQNAEFNWKNAVMNLFVDQSPIICTDQLEMWTEDDITFFYEEIKKVKRFSDIGKKNCTWKSVKEMVEFYYMGKVTEQYMNIKKDRLNRKSSGIHQIFIPNSNSPLNTNLTTTKMPPIKCICRGCATKESTHWYPWMTAIRKDYVLCTECWIYWKKYGGLKASHSDDGIKQIESPYFCHACHIPFLNKHRFDRHCSNHYSHACDIDNCQQKFADTKQLEKHKTYLHHYLAKIPSYSNTQSKLFCFWPSVGWRKLRREYCSYAVNIKALCRNRIMGFDKNISLYEGRVPVKKSNRKVVRLGDLLRSSRKRPSSKLQMVKDRSTSPPPKVATVN